MRTIHTLFFLYIFVSHFGCSRSSNEIQYYKPYRADSIALDSIGIIDVNKKSTEYLLSNIVYNRPDSMNLNETTLISLIIGNASLYNAEELKEELSSAEKNIVSKQRNLTTEVGAVLRGINFEIEPDTEVKQRITSDMIYWDWSIKPKTTGLHPLSLVIYNYITVDGQKSKQQLKAFNDEIFIYVPPKPWYKSLFDVVNNHFELFITVVLLPLLAIFRKKIKQLFKRRSTTNN